MLLFLGDVHGEFIELTKRITRAQITDSHIIQVGDFGVGFNGKHEATDLQNLDRLLMKTNNSMFVIRGNHDDPAFFKGNSAFRRISFVPDYTVLTIEGLNILLAGGALSVDRSLRTAGVNYWHDEVFVYDEQRLAKALSGIARLDIVVTHNAPTEFWPYTFENLVYKFSKRDSALMKDLKEDRLNHSKLLSHLEILGLLPKAWFYGHFHASYSGSYATMKYILVNSLELAEYRP